MRYSTAFLLGLWAGHTLAEESKVMRLGTNIMPPYTVVTEGRQLAGQATETLNCVFDALPSYRYETSIAPWPRVVRLADQGRIDGWFLYVRNATSDRFAELSEPLQLETWYWYSHQPIGDAVLSDFLDDSILVLNGTYQQVWLQAQGFSNFLTVQSNDSLVRAFVARRADHLLISDSVFDETLAGLNGELAGVERRFVGYIQLGLYVTNDYLAEHPEFMRRFNSAAHACRSDNPELTEADRRQLQSLVDELAQWKDADWMRQSLTEMNRTNQYLTRAEIETLDSSWIAQFDTGVGAAPMIDEMMNSELSIRLSYIKQQSDGIFSEIFVTDRWGLNAGVSDPTSDYYQGDEAIFNAIVEQRQPYYIDALEYDSSSRTFQVKISVPVIGEHGEILGVLVAGVDVEQALRGFN